MLFRIAMMLTLVVFATACTTEEPSVAKNETGGLPDSVFLTTKPTDAKPLGQTKASAAVGDTVTFDARIGGRVEPFIDQRAVMIVIDSKLPPCAEIEGDGCPTPWDYCCETKESLMANTATVRFVDDAGQPRKVAIEKVNGLEPLANITVVGKVAENADGQFVIDATGVFVSKG